MAELCRRCGAEIVTANLMDIDPGVERAHFALVLSGNRRRQLSPTEWRLFAALYGRHGRVVPNVELGRAADDDLAVRPQRELTALVFARDESERPQDRL